MDDDKDNDLPLNERIDLIDRNDPSITNFELEYHEVRHMTEDQIRALFRGMRQNTHVRKLDLYWIPHELRHAILHWLLPPLLQENLSIRYLQFPEAMTNAEFLPSVDAFCNPIDRRWVYCHKTTIETLSLRGCDIKGPDGGEMIGRLIWNHQHITTIDLRWNKRLGPAGAARIAPALGDENCKMKILDLGWCGIGDEGVDALCTALQVNNSSLETFRFCRKEITDEGYRALAMSGIQEIHFGWEQLQVSAAVLQQMMDSLHKNQSLQRITFLYPYLSAEWNTRCTFVCARNRMNCHFLGEARSQMRVAKREERGVAPVPIPIGLLVWWCSRQGNSEVQASLIYLLLRSRSDELVGLADIVAEEDGEKEKAITDAMTMRTGDMQSETTRRAPRSIRKWISLFCCRRKAKSR